MSRCIALAMSVCSLLAASQVNAQNSSTNYTRNVLNSIALRNSAAGYSADRTRTSAYRSSIPQYAYSTVGRNAWGGSLPTQKPFANRQSGPSVTPYLGLTSPFTSSASNYYTLVRPQLEQQRLNEQMEARNIAMQRQLNSLTARPPYELTGDSKHMPTGHQTVFMNTLDYYPSPVGQQPRR